MTDKETAAMRMQYAGAIQLLCDCSLALRRGGECDEMRDNIVRAVDDWCTLTGWTYQRILHRIELFPPKEGKR